MKNSYFWYKNIVTFDLIYKLNLKNSFGLPKIENICLNSCLQSIVENPKTLLYSLLAFKILTLQTPTVCKANKSLSFFNLRKGMIMGVKIILRKNYMYHFLCLLTLFVLPVFKSIFFVSHTGCLSIGVANIFSFPQLHFFQNKFFKIFGCNININILKGNSSFSKLLLTGLQLPL